VAGLELPLEKVLGLERIGSPSNSRALQGRLHDDLLQLNALVSIKALVVSRVKRQKRNGLCGKR
jgi:hypothetical protein